MTIRLCRSNRSLIGLWKLEWSEWALPENPDLSSNGVPFSIRTMVLSGLVQTGKLVFGGCCCDLAGARVAITATTVGFKPATVETQLVKKNADSIESIGFLK